MGDALLKREKIYRGLVQLMVDYFPKRSHSVVAAFPDDEGNGVEVLRLLVERDAGRVYWLVDGIPDELLWLLNGIKTKDRLRLVRKRSLHGILLFASARTVFFTHGLYFKPSPPPGAVFVNLWHGDGPKSRGNANFKQSIPSTYIVSGTLLWGLNRLRSFGLQENQLLVTGNPRIDQFERPASDAALRTVGIDPEKPLIIWMPTYRETRGTGRLQWNDASLLSDRQEIHLLLREVGRRSHSSGVTFVVKPHPMDKDTFLDTGIVVLTDTQLRRAQIGLYQLLARTAGLITDYSSVWTDYLVLNRPISFYCPDLPEYIDGRGLNVHDLPSLLPGPILNSANDFASFFAACTAGKPAFHSARQQSVRLIGAETRTAATSRLLDALGSESFRKELQAQKDLSKVNQALLRGDKAR